MLRFDLFALCHRLGSVQHDILPFIKNVKHFEAVVSGCCMRTMNFFVAFRCNLFDLCNVQCLSFKVQRCFQQTVKELSSSGTRIFILKWIPRGREKGLAVRTYRLP